jgi:hypothetical protein
MDEGSALPTGPNLLSRRGTILLAFHAVLAAACGGLALPDQTVETKWAHYHYWSDEVPCPEALERLDGFVDLLQAEFGRTLSSKFRFDYYKLRRSEENILQNDLCHSLAAAACTGGTTTYATDWVQLHELVLEVAGTIGEPPTAFEEGLAEVYGCGAARWVGAPIDRSIDLEGVLPTSDWDAQVTFPAYLAAGAFTRYLLDTFGTVPYFDLYRALGNGDGIGDIDRAFQRILGVSLDTALSQWRASPAQSEGQICHFLIDACSSAPLLGASNPGDTASLSAPVSCLGNDAVVDVASNTDGVVGFTADQPSRMLTVRPCDFPSDSPFVNFDWVDSANDWSLPEAPPPGCDTYADSYGIPESEYVGKRLELWTSFRPGRYILQYGNVFPQDPGGGNATVDVTFAPSFVVVDTPSDCPISACGSAAAVTVPDGLWSIDITVGAGSPSNGGLTGFLKLNLPSPRLIVEYTGPFYGSTAFTQFCSAGCPTFEPGAPVCSDFSQAPGTPASGTVTFWLDWDTTHGEYVRLLLRPPTN